MASPTSKKGLDKNLLIGLGAIILIAGAIFLFRSCTRDECPAKIEIAVSGDLIVDGVVQFDDLTDGATEWDWDFGDQSPHEYVRNPKHTFTKEGTYRILLIINGRCDAIKEISILPKQEAIQIDVPDLPVATIVGPEEAMVGEPVHFRDASTVATSWEWMFNESGKVDATTREVDYTYKSPGTFSVVLIINGKSEQVIHRIRVKPAKKKAPEPGKPAPPAPPVMNSVTFINTMKKVAERKAKFDAFDPYFCGDKTIKITLPDKSVKTLMAFCLEVYRDKSFTGNSASFTTDKDSDCITAIKLN